MVQNNSGSNGQSTSREQYKASKKKGNAPSREEMKNEESQKLRVRVIPIWLRLIIIVLIFVLCLAAGLAIGYGVIGDGNVKDVFSKDTWQHIVDLVKKEQ